MDLLVTPFATALALMLVRHTLGWRGYLGVSLALVLATLAISAFCPTIVFYYKGPLNAAGLDSWVLVPAAFTVVAVCALPPVQVWRFFQPFVAAFLAFEIMMRGHWIA